jgi:hypothetical protein
MSAADRALLRSLPVTSPSLTWASLAGTVSLVDLVAVGDFLVTPPFGTRRSLASIDDLTTEVVARAGHRGHRMRRTALDLVRVGALSRPETHLRLLLTRVGLPEPLVNLSADGFLLDLAWPDLRVCVEYEGDHHRDVDQFRRDLRRIEALTDCGWVVIRVTADDLYRRPVELVRRVARRLEARGWRGGIDLR